MAAIADETRVAGGIVRRRAAAGTGPREAVDEVQRANVLVRARARPSEGGCCRRPADDDDDDDAAAAAELLRATLCDVRADFLRRFAGSATDAPADEDAVADLLPTALAVRFKRS